MNVFEMFGFFMIGSMFNMIIILIFLLVLFIKLSKVIDKNVKGIIDYLVPMIEKVDKITSRFSKGEQYEN